MDAFAHQYGPWALVTGASSGLGAEFAAQLAARGLDVVLVGRRRGALEATAVRVEAAGARALVLPVDLQGDGAARVVELVDDLDLGLIVHSAGLLSTGRFDEVAPSVELSLLEVNVRAPLVITRRLLPKLKARGRGGVIFLSSFVAYRGAPGMAGYAASKAWTLSLAESLGPEVAPDGVDVLAVCPGFVQTPMLARFLPLLHRVRSMGVSQPEPVVVAALRALGRRYSVIPGLRDLWLHRLMRLLPRDYVSRAVGRRLAPVFLAAPSERPPRPRRPPRSPSRRRSARSVAIPPPSPQPVEVSVAPPGARARSSRRPAAPRATTSPPATTPSVSIDTSS